MTNHSQHTPALSPTSKLKSIAIACILTLVAVSILYQVAHSLLHQSLGYYETDWMINYEGGFVRRGLSGSILLYATRWTHISPTVLITVLQLSLSLTYFILLIRKAKSSNILPLLYFLLFFATNPILRFYFFEGRGMKDLLVLILTVWHISIARRAPSNGYVLQAVFPVSLGGALLALCHEGLALFYWLPTSVFIAMFFRARLRPHELLLLYGPTICAIIASIAATGTPEQGHLIRDSWRSMNIAWPAINAVDEGISQSLTSALTEVRGIYGSVNILYFFGVALFSLYPIVRCIKLVTPSIKGVSLLAILAFTCSPLFLIGLDYQRWVALYIGVAVIFALEGIVEIVRISCLSGPHILATSIAWACLSFGGPYPESSKNTLSVLDRFASGPIIVILKRGVQFTQSNLKRF